ncbi:hypothetical protein CDL15_Pgr009358 [Punica granatum]|uniref:Uncharacterized protein n=1 Tax=Punica granatum TaxID=22663 RepID=A0A218XI27_PUNGR|nr:hypothetical protein CDL15_Pgr009358 [Punica granatum]PKI79023.1 hypothetical protein CRG98_000596 [Punica granatum]
MEDWAGLSLTGLLDRTGLRFGEDGLGQVGRRELDAAGLGRTLTSCCCCWTGPGRCWTGSPLPDWAAG